MRKLLYSVSMLVIAFCLVVHSTVGQDRCITEIMFQEEAKANPQIIKNRIAFEQEIENFIKSNPEPHSPGVKRIIPVVFHVIHEYGGSNISKAQILDQIRILNEDFNRLNADTSDTPIPFKAVAADCDVEFRLATIDPNGNCTEGIVRYYSPLTNNANNDVKALSYWPSNKYLNYWVVRYIEAIGGLVNPSGYAQFPGTGQNPLTDGIVCRADRTGSLFPNLGAGRTPTHEVGHWLSLRHIWGDDGTACTGSDFVADTPNQAGPNSGCPNFPSVSCSNGPNGDMFSNYMDYTAGDCRNIYTLGQKARIDATLNSSISGRSNLWSVANLIATGTDDNTQPQICTPIADFDSRTMRICTGVGLTYNDTSYNGIVTSRIWSFPGGTPSTSTDKNPVVTYNTPGQYSVSLTVSNSSGSDTKTVQNKVIVSPANAWYPAPFNEDFEITTLPGWYWFVENDFTTSNSWEVSNAASVSGTSCARLINYTNNGPGVDAFITPSVNLGNVSGTQLTFQLAHAARSTTGDNALKVFVSTDCGQSWTMRYNKSGSSLSTAGIVTSNFVPLPGDWRMETVNLGSSSISGKPNVIFKFEYTNVNGNNIYIDDININGVVGLSESINPYQIKLYPNPAKQRAQLTFSLIKEMNIKITLENILGKKVQIAEESRLSAGMHNYLFETSSLAKGIYFIKISFDNTVLSKKLVIQ